MNASTALKDLHNHQAYDYKKGWSSTAHPIPNATEEEYIEIAQAAQSDASEQARNFLQKNSFSYIEIPHEAFFEYEKSDSNFREWIEKYCSEQNKLIRAKAKIDGIEPELINSRADVAIIGPRVKTLESAKRKTATGAMQPDRLIDYLGIELVALKQTRSKKNKQSLDTMASAIQALEQDPDTLARKNHYWKPHDKTKFRAAKTLRLATVGEDHAFSGMEILTEWKIEHESQMDIDKLTRKFINIGRGTQKAFTNIFSSAGKVKLSTSESKRYAKFCMDESDKQNAIDILGGLLYNRLFTDIGINKFMDPNEVEKFSALHLRALFETTKVTMEEHFTGQNCKDMINTVLGMEMFKKFKPTTKVKPVNQRRTKN